MSLSIQPNEKKGPHITVRFPLSVHATITRLAREHHSTVTEIVRALVLAGMEHAAAAGAAAQEESAAHGVETP